MKKTALFIGGTKGLGLELARRAYADGWGVTIAGRSALECLLVTSDCAKPFPLDLEADRIEIPPDQGPFDLIAWVAGIYQEGSFIDLVPSEMVRLTRAHLTGPISAITELLRRNRRREKPCHLVVIGSTSSYVSRVDESYYDALKAAKAQLARALGKELPRDLPGSRVLLACPGGMATPFWEGRGRDTSRFMDPFDVAFAIWHEVQFQKTPFLEIRLLRQPDRSPKVEYGPQLQE
jgi:NAD(P)-dependent dehydrogenase (short-subunit alcohol dehydrogenase family)